MAKTDRLDCPNIRNHKIAIDEGQHGTRNEAQLQGPTPANFGTRTVVLKIPWSVSTPASMTQNATILTNSSSM